MNEKELYTFLKNISCSIVANRRKITKDIVQRDCIGDKCKDYNMCEDAGALNNGRNFYETQNGYKKKVLRKNEDGDVKESEITIAPFIIEPEELIICDDFIEQKATVHYNGKKYSTTFTARDFLTVKDFKNAIAKKIHPSIWFDGNQKELTEIQKIITRKKVKEIIGVKCSGFHKLNGEWYYVTSRGALKSDGDICDNVTLLSNCSEIENPNIVNNEDLSEIEMRTLAESLFKFNSLGITASYIGYTLAIFLKERLWTEHNMKFPNMSIIGASGAGKSQTMESIGMTILNMDSNRQQAANQCTKFVGLKSVSSSNTAPFVINEYKPHKMAQWVVDEIDNLMNNTYDRYESKRGKSDQTTETYSLNAPIILLGEAYNPDQSAIERIIRIYLSKDESMKSYEKFKTLKNLKPLLNKLGKSLLLKVLRLSNEQIEAWIKNNSNLVETTDIKVTRGKENLIITLLGIDLLNETLDKCLSSHIEKLKMAVLDRYKDDTLEGNSSSKSAIGEMLEIFNQLIAEDKLVCGVHFKQIERDNEIALDVKTIFGIAMEVANIRRQNLPLNEAEFTRMLRKEPFYKSYKDVKLKSLTYSIYSESKNRKCFILDLSELLKLKLEISNITGVDAEGEFAEAK